MELQRLKARLALIDEFLERTDASSERARQLKKTVFVLRRILVEESDLVSPYGPATGMARFSLQ